MAISEVLRSTLVRLAPQVRSQDLEQLYKEAFDQTRRPEEQAQAVEELKLLAKTDPVAFKKAIADIELYASESALPSAKAEGAQMATGLREIANGTSNAGTQAPATVPQPPQWTQPASLKQRNDVVPVSAAAAAAIDSTNARAAASIFPDNQQLQALYLKDQAAKQGRGAALTADERTALQQGYISLTQPAPTAPAQANNASAPLDSEQSWYSQAFAAKNQLKHGFSANRDEVAEQTFPSVVDPKAAMAERRAVKFDTFSLTGRAENDRSTVRSFSGTTADGTPVELRVDTDSSATMSGVVLGRRLDASGKPVANQPFVPLTKEECLHLADELKNADAEKLHGFSAYVREQVLTVVRGAAANGNVPPADFLSR